MALLNTTTGDKANIGEALGLSQPGTRFDFSDGVGRVDLALVSFGQCGLDLFLSLEHQRGNLLIFFWYLRALKGDALNVTTGSSGGRAMIKAKSYEKKTKPPISGTQKTPWNYHQEILSVLDCFLRLNHVLGSW